MLYLSLRLISVKVFILFFFHILFSPTEPESEQTHLITKVLRLVLCSGCG